MADHQLIIPLWVDTHKAYLRLFITASIRQHMVGNLFNI
jgi:hypothetical protein